MRTFVVVFLILAVATTTGGATGADTSQLLRSASSSSIRRDLTTGTTSAIPHRSCPTTQKKTINTLRKALKKTEKLKKQRQGGQDEDHNNFNPSVDDPDWPGRYPNETADEDEELLVLNIREDDFPDEIRWNFRTVFSKSSDDYSYYQEEETDDDEEEATTTTSITTRQGAFSSPMERRLVSISITSSNKEGEGGFYKNETLYQIEITDLLGDGICCSDYGLGWISITDRQQNVIWSTRGDYGYVATVYLWKDAEGNFTVVGTTNPITQFLAGQQQQQQQQQGNALPNNNPSLMGGGNGGGGSSNSTCVLCPEGTMGSPNTTFRIQYGQQQQQQQGPGGDHYQQQNWVDVSCSDMEAMYELGGLTTQQCTDFENQGITQYYRSICSCPGYEPTCPMCNGNPVTRPNNILPSNDTSSSSSSNNNNNNNKRREPTCFDFEVYFLFLEQEDCASWETENKNNLELFCGCP